jgi:hypothetical protein
MKRGDGSIYDYQRTSPSHNLLSRLYCPVTGLNRYGLFDFTLPRMMNLKSENYFGLDQVGTRMWTLMTTSDSIQSAYEVLLDEYDVGADRLREDMRYLIEKLIANGLVEVAAGQAA